MDTDWAAVRWFFENDLGFLRLLGFDNRNVFVTHRSLAVRLTEDLTSCLPPPSLPFCSFTEVNSPFLHFFFSGR